MGGGGVGVRVHPWSAAGHHGRENSNSRACLIVRGATVPEDVQQAMRQYMSHVARAIESCRTCEGVMLHM